MFLPSARMRSPSAASASGWQKGSPPEKVTPLISGSAFTCRTISSGSAG